MDEQEVVASRAPARVRFISHLVGVAVFAVLAASCAAPAPLPGQTVPLRWGDPLADHVDVPYGAHARQVADVYLPKKGGNRGVIVLAHGGGFVAGSKDDVADGFGAVMRQTHRGFAVLAVNYRVAVGNRDVFPAGARDVSLAVDWVRREGRSFGMNPGTIIVSGGSAGGTIAALVGAGGNSSPTSALGRTAKVDGYLSFAGIYDFRHGPAGVTNYGRTWLGARGSSNAWLNAASPVNHLDRNDPPGFIVHGDVDDLVPVSQAYRMLEKAAAAGIGARMFYDIVDTGPRACRWHVPTCGMNSKTLDEWVDHVVARAL